MLALSPAGVDELIGASWCEWTAHEVLSAASLPKLLAAVLDFIPRRRKSDSASLVPNAESPRREPFAQDTGGSQIKLNLVEEYSGKHNGEGHSNSGAACKCGKIHVRRGDRVRRGAGIVEDHEGNVVAGGLGTIVRIGHGEEMVLVKWDRSAADQATTYVWPDPSGAVLGPASFADVAEDVSEIQRLTGLSSMASEELLRRSDYDIAKTRKSLADRSDVISERDLRKPPQLFHQVRILPDSVLVQEWFDAVPPCTCESQRCHGGLQWSSRAHKHLGREGIVLKMDDNDNTVLVRTIGPCECNIWYPQLAVETVYNPDLTEKPLFSANSRVECRMESGWLLGVVSEVLWNGSERSGPCPYTATLDDGRSIFVPDSRLIRAGH
jgi:hypothetical protein